MGTDDGSSALSDLIRRAPKVELHLHLEGTLEPELMMELADANGVRLPYADLDAVRAAYDFVDLQSFLDVYYAGAGVLQGPADFERLTWEYLTKVAAEGVRHVEVFFDPQSHTDRGIAFDDVVDGIGAALDRAGRQLDVTSVLIACVLRHLPPEAGEPVLDAVLRRPDRIAGLGLDSSERDRPPALFAELYARARANGLFVTAHAGEEGPAAYVAEAVDVLGIQRIDHGVRTMEDPALVQRLAAEQLPFTVCPVSNVALQVFPDLGSHPLGAMLDAGLAVTVNSDDPSYFGAYLTENLVATTEALRLDRAQVLTLLGNAIDASIAPPARRLALRRELAAAAGDGPVGHAGA